MMSPHINTNRKGEVHPIMIQQFRIDVALTAIHNNVYHKIARLHYVRATPKQATEIVLTHLRDHKCTLGKCDHSWFVQHKVLGFNIC